MSLFLMKNLLFIFFNLNEIYLLNRSHNINQRKQSLYL